MVADINMCKSFNLKNSVITVKKRANANNKEILKNVFGDCSEYLLDQNINHLLLTKC